jgi:hypothetical protein
MVEISNFGSLFFFFLIFVKLHWMFIQLYKYTDIHKLNYNINRVSGFTMLDTPVPFQTMKLSNIGPGYYLDGRPFREIQVLLVHNPLPPPVDRVVFSDSLCLNQVIETR